MEKNCTRGATEIAMEQSKIQRLWNNENARNTTERNKEKS